MTVERALWLLDRMATWYPEPTEKIRKEEFDLLAYNHWAYKELSNYVYRRKSDISPVSAVEEFREKMDDYACKAKTGEANFIFSVAYDVATDILDLFISDEGGQDVEGFNKYLY